MATYSRVATTTTDVIEIALRTRKLYRHSLKIIPWLQDTYEIDYHKKHMAKAVRTQFEKHSHIKSPYTASVLLHQGENELQEALNVWKTRSHVVKFFEPVVTDERDIWKRIWEGESLLPDLITITEDDVNWYYPPKLHTKTAQ